MMGHYMAGVGIGLGAVGEGDVAVLVGMGDITVLVGMGEGDVLVRVGVVVVRAGRDSLQWLVQLLLIMMPHVGVPEPVPDSLL